MDCKIKTLTGLDTPSKLYTQLLGIAKGNESLANQYIAHFKSEAFKSLFGDYVTDFTKPLNDRTIESKRVNDSGEPFLFLEDNYVGKYKGKYYYLDKNNAKVYYPSEGLDSVLTLNRIDSLKKTLASKYIMRYFGSLQSIASVDNIQSVEETLSEFIRESLNDRKKELDGLGGFKNKLNSKLIEKILLHTKELEEIVVDHFATLKIKYETEEVKNAKDDESETTKDLPFNTASFERSYKQNINTEIKLMLSLIENNDESKKDPTLNESSFYEYEFVYNTILRILAGTHVPYGKDKFEAYLDKLKLRAPFIPMLNDVISILENDTVRGNHNLRTKFVQSFELNKNIFVTFEMNKRLSSASKKSQTKGSFDESKVSSETKDTSSEEKKDVISFKSFDVSDLNSNKNKIRDEWGLNFRNKLGSQKVNEGRTSVSYTVSKNRIGAIRTAFNEFTKNAVKIFQAPDSIQSQDIYDTQYKEIFNFLHQIGANITEEGFEYYVMSKADNLVDIQKKLDVLNDIKNKLTYFLSDVANGKVNPSYTVEETLRHENIFLELAEAEAVFFTDVSDASFFSAGKTYWGYSKPSYVDNKTSEIKEDLEYHKKMIESSEFYRNSRVLKYLEAAEITDPIARAEAMSYRRSQFNAGIFNTLQQTGDLFKAVNNKDLTENDEILMNLNSLLTFKTGGNPFIRTTTAGDKNTQRVIQLPKEIFINSQYNYETGYIADSAIEVLYDYWVDEYNRAAEVADVIESKDESKFYKHVHYGLKNGLKSQLFPSLSPVFSTVQGVEIVDQPILRGTNEQVILFDEKGYPAMREGLDENSKKAIKAHIKEIVIEKISSVEKELKDIGAFKGINNQSTKNLNIDQEVFNKYKEGNVKSSNIRYNIAADFYLNGIMSNVEYSKLYSGDYAYYKDMVDYKKRIPATYSDGQYLNPIQGEETFKVSIISSVEGVYNRKDEFDALVAQKVITQKTADYYIKNTINIADGQGWITPKRWYNIMRDLGKDESLLNSVYNKMVSGETLTTRELKFSMQPLKGVYFEIVDGKPTFIKYSQAVLIPSLIKGTSFENLYNAMIDPETGFDELLTEDAVKAGVMKPVSTHNIENASVIKSDFDITSLNKYEMNNRSWKLQQDLPTKLNKDTDVGSQIQKNILLGLAFNSDTQFSFRGEVYTNEDIIDMINETVGNLSAAGISKMYKSLGISSNGEIKNKQKFLNNLADQLVKQDGDANIIKALRSGVNPFGIPQASSKIAQLFMSGVVSNIVKIKTNGGSFIQMSGYGLDFDSAVNKDVIMTPWALKNAENKNETYSYSILKDSNGNIRYGENGKPLIKPAGMFVPGGFIAKFVPDYMTRSPKELFGELNPETNEYEGGLIDSKILKNWIGYRIPNQGLSSNDAFEIAGILPPRLGDTIIAYTGITTKTGSDYDIDKLYFMMPYISPQYRNDNSRYDGVREELSSLFEKETYEDTISTIEDFLDDLYAIDNTLELEYFNSEAIADLIFEEPGEYDMVEAYELLSDLIYDTKHLQIRELERMQDFVFNEIPVKLHYSVEGYKGEANKLIELYQSVLLNPDILNEVLTPTDSDFYKNNIIAFNPQEELSDLDAFDIVQDVKTKAEYKAGKAGVGMEANALIDYIKGNLAHINLGGKYIGAGRTGALGTLLDQEYSEELSDEEIKIYVEAYNKRNSKKITEAQIKEEGLDKIKIAHTLSAILNAFVDIAKDPFITRGNWNTVTTNTGNLLMRAGVHPFKTNAFLNHKSVKEYIKFQTNKESMAVNDTGKMFEKFKIDLFRKSSLMTNLRISIEGRETSLSYSEFHSFLFEDVPLKGILKTSKDDIMKLIFEKKINGKQVFNKDVFLENEVAFTSFAETVSSAKEIYSHSFDIVEEYFPSLDSLLNEPIDYIEDLRNDAMILAKFNEMLELSKELRDTVASSRSDVEGPGKSTASLIAKKNMIERLKGDPLFDEDGVVIGYDDSKNTIKNYHLKFEKDGVKTMLGHYTDNSVFDIYDIIIKNPDLFFEAQPLMIDIKNQISLEMFNKSKIENVEVAEKIDKILKGVVLSEFPLLKVTAAEYIYLVSNKFTAEYTEFKKEFGHRYPILQELFLKEGVATFGIGLSNRNRNPGVKQDLVKSWNEMYNTPEHKQFAIKLARYSAIVSGLEMNKSQFFTLIPSEMFISYDINQFLSTFSDKYSQHLDSMVDEVYLSNPEDNQMVPFVPKEDIVPYTSEMYHEFGKDLKLASIERVFKIPLKLDPVGNIVVQPKRFYKSASYDDGGRVSSYTMYKLSSYDSLNNAVYLKVPSKGMIKKNAKIYDYSVTGHNNLIFSKDETMEKIKSIVLANSKEYNGSTIVSQKDTLTPPSTKKRSVEVTTERYTQKMMKANPNKMYIFTENAHSFTNGVTRAGGGTAIIRPFKNAFPIITKKVYDYVTRENKDFQDTAEDFAMFRSLNTTVLENILNSNYENVIVPNGFATDKAKLPLRFAEWLKETLSTSLGIETQIINFSDNTHGLKTIGIEGGKKSSSIHQVRTSTLFDQILGENIEDVNVLEGNETVNTETSNQKGTVNVYWGQVESATSTRILSNLAPRKFNYESIDGVTREYGSVEHAYQSNKSGTFDKSTYDKYIKIGGYGRKIRGKGTVTEMKASDSLGLMKKLVVESFKQNPNSDATTKLLQYENFTHNTNELIDKAFLEGLKLAQQELRQIFQNLDYTTSEGFINLKNRVMQDISILNNPELITELEAITTTSALNEFINKYCK